MDKTLVVEWLSALTPKQFVEVFYAAAPNVERRVDEYKGQESRLVLLQVSRERTDDDPWTDWRSQLICPAPESWDDDAPICQEGSHCGFPTLSWSKRSTCPICAAEVYGT